MRQAFLTADDQTVVNRASKDLHEYERQRELLAWFESTHHVELVWKSNEDGSRTVEGVKAVLSKETLTIRGKGDLKGHWLKPTNGVYRPCKGNFEVWDAFRSFEWHPRPLPGISSRHAHTPYTNLFMDDGRVYLSMPVEDVDDRLWREIAESEFHAVMERFAASTGDGPQTL